MKLWRKLAKKDSDGKRNGRQIRYMMYLQEMAGKRMVKTYPLLQALLERAGAQPAVKGTKDETI